MERSQEKRTFVACTWSLTLPRSLQVRRVGRVAFASMWKADRFSANEFSTKLLGCIGIDVSGDEAGVHP